MKKPSILLLAPAVAAALSIVAPAHAASVELTLGNEHTGAYIQTYFNNGTDSQGASGPNLGFGFSANAQVQKAGNSVSTGNGKFTGNPSGQLEILDFAASTASTPNSYSGTSYINFAQGFSSINFNYSLATDSSTYDLVAEVFSGVNGTGTELTSFALNADGAANACTVRSNAYCNWIAASASGLSGAKSIEFVSGATAQNSGINALTFAEFDGVTVTPAAPVPLPAAVWLLASGLGGLGALRRRRSSEA